MDCLVYCQKHVGRDQKGETIVRGSGDLQKANQDAVGNGF